MRLLLDTHIALWAITADPRLSPQAKKILMEAEAAYVSAASVWEIAIKHSLGKISPGPEVFADAVEAAGFIALPITDAHAGRVARLPPLHADPFDRLLVAQALTEPLRLVTADSRLSGYSELVIPL
jgi:PIN domain nuclease of toxin-antitoxin system